MATDVILVTGGVRSGKSSYAEALARKYSQVCYVATAWPGDAEMEERIRLHRRHRPGHWQTIEEQLDLARVLDQNYEAQCLLIDCLGMWVTNLLCQQGIASVQPSLDGLIRAVQSFPGVVIMVSNEVGWGLVPANELGRQFRDLLGWVNQKVAQVSDEVVLMVAGCPLWVKGTGGKVDGL